MTMVLNYLKSEKYEEMCETAENHWTVETDTAEKCLNHCAKHENCQKANFISGNSCHMYPIGSKTCDHRHGTHSSKPVGARMIRCEPKRCRHGRNKHDCLKNAGSEGAFCNRFWPIDDDNFGYAGSNEDTIGFNMHCNSCADKKIPADCKMKREWETEWNSVYKGMVTDAPRSANLESRARGNPK